ncbi:MAG: sigma-54-dependent Fis family transcriptional regulator [Gemmatimonadetes bacterium]|nr:sigma-54-dependent Fis family transcriptional regulator [Gemmatimonadota bacterium]
MRVLRLHRNAASRICFRDDFGPDVGAALTHAKANGVPATFIVHEGDRERLRALDELIVERSKTGKKGLREVALGETSIPLLTGDYRSAGQFLRSTCDLQRNAVALSDRNVYLVVAPAAIFEELWAGARTPSPPSDDARSVTPSEGSTVMRLLGQIKVPERVRQEFLGASLEVQLVHRYIVRAASNGDTVLIWGPTGTGKDVVARLIHDLGSRAQAPFVRVNCAHEAELLFANGRKRALWSAAEGGTLFLDEVSGLSPALQARVFDVIAEGETRTVHGPRLLAASNRDLLRLVEMGEFREDLYYVMRRNVIRTPALREHADDIPLLAAELWKRATRDRGSVLRRDVLQYLKERPWPGNMRELSICLHGVVNLFGSTGITIDHVKVVLALDRPGDGGSAPGRDALAGQVQAAERGRHARRAVDAIRSATTMVERWRRAGGMTPESRRGLAAAISDRVAELELLARRRALFGGATVVGAVQEATQALRGFGENVLRDGADAVAAWERDVRDACERAIGSLGT